MIYSSKDKIFRLWLITVLIFLIFEWNKYLFNFNNLYISGTSSFADISIIFICILEEYNINTIIFLIAWFFNIFKNKSKI